MRIHRSHPDDHFTIIPNETLRDQRLSYTARGVLIELLSHADGWQTTADDLSEMARRHRGEKRGEGRRGIRNAFKELVDHGYIVRRRLKDESGKFVTVLELFDTPGHGDATTTDHRGTANGTSVTGTSATGMSATGTSLRSTNLRSTKEEEPSEEHFTSLVDTRAAAADAAARQTIEERLEDLYEAVNQLGETDLRNCLLAFERKRPKVFRDCRKEMLVQYQAEDPGILKRRIGSVAADRLAYKYALKHYKPVPPKAHEWPAWVIRPLLPVQQRGRSAA